MAKAKKSKSKKVSVKYDEKLAVNGSFMDIMKASVEQANKKSAKKKV